MMYDQLEELGYSIQSDSAMDIDSFIKQNFPGFDLIKLLQVIEQTFTPTSSIHIQKKIIVNEKECSLKIDYQNQYTGEDDALLFIRRFENSKDGIIIHHDYCIIPEIYRGKGLIKKVFQESLQQYINMGAKKILVHAGLSGGGYVWAKHDFRAVNKDEIVRILNKAQRQLSDSDFTVVELIYNTYYNRNPNGKHFPIILWAAMDCMKLVLMGSDWHGELDLTNPAELNNFRNYVFSK